MSPAISSLFGFFPARTASSPCLPTLPFSHSWPSVFSHLSDSLSSHVSAENSEECWDKWGLKGHKDQTCIKAESFSFLQEELLIPEYHCLSSSLGHFPRPLERGCTPRLLSQGPAWISGLTKKSRQDGYPVPASSFGWYILSTKGTELRREEEGLRIHRALDGESIMLSGMT